MTNVSQQDKGLMSEGNQHIKQEEVVNMITQEEYDLLVKKDSTVDWEHLLEKGDVVVFDSKEKLINWFYLDNEDLSSLLYEVLTKSTKGMSDYPTVVDALFADNDQITELPNDRWVFLYD